MAVLRLAAFAPVLAAAALVVLSAPPSAAEQPIGTWRFQDEEKPVKVVVIGGSVSAYRAGGFPQWIASICSDIELVNLGRAKLGAFELRQRFTAQVLKNRRLDAETKAKTWLLFLGGLNSVGSPETTNREVAKTLRLAKDAGISTFAVSVNPWGSEGDRRWQGVEGVAYWEHTQKTVDFLLGRSTPSDAFGEAAARERDDPTRFLPGELPDIAVDIWDGTLRDRDAPLRDVDRLERAAKRSAWLKRRLREVPEEGRAQMRALLLAQAASLPRWFMREELVGFDAIHPNALGHREIAQAICDKAPPSWRCACDELEHLAWDRRHNKPKSL